MTGNGKKRDVRVDHRRVLFSQCKQRKAQYALSGAYHIIAPCLSKTPEVQIKSGDNHEENSGDLCQSILEQTKRK